MTFFVNTHAKHTRGFSLIEILVSLAVLIIVMGVMASYLSSVSNQERILIQRADATAIDNNLQNIMQSTSQHCSGNIKAAGITVPTGAVNAGPFNIACPNPPGGCPMTFLSYYKSNGKIGQPALYTGLQPDGSGLVIASVQLQNVTTTGVPDQYSANLVVNYGGTPAPPAALIPIQLSATTAGATDTLQSCSQGSCAPGYYLVTNKNGSDSFCIGQSTDLGHAEVHFTDAEANCVGYGYHVCTESEWMKACMTDSPHPVPPYGNVGDGGPILKMGELPTADGDTSEWAGTLVYSVDNTGKQEWGATIMGGNDPKEGGPPGSIGNNTCFSFTQDGQEVWHAGGWVHSYRCCYRP